MRRIYAILPLLILFLSGLSAQEQKKQIVMKPALLIIDVQKEFLPMMSKEDQDFAINMMNYSMMVFRHFDLPVVRIYHSSADYGVVPGTPGFEFADTLKILPSDPMVIKTYPSAFVKTELDSLLRSKEINTLFLCGLSSVGCVLATYIEAQSHDYKAFLIKDALLSHKEKYTEQIEEIFSALDLETVMYMLEVGTCGK